MKNIILLAFCCILICSSATFAESSVKQKTKTTGIRMAVHGESLVLAKTDPGNLCFDKIVKGSIVVRSTYKPDDANCVVYKENVDYTVNYAKGTIARTENSSIPDFSKNVLYGLKDFDHVKFPGFSNHPFLIWADYTTTNGKQWAKPNDQSKYLTRVRAKLRAGGPFTIVWYGDSITAGGEASTLDRQFKAMYSKYLQNKFPKAKIDFQDASIPGYTSTQGIEWWDKYIGKTSPDLVMLGWGMNDHNINSNEPDVFKQNLITLVKMIRERKGADVILYSAFPPNNNWKFGTHRMALYAQATRQAAVKTGCAYVNIYDTWNMVLKRKDQSSMLGNNINHPTDFGHWLYEQAFEAMKF